MGKRKTRTVKSQILYKGEKRSYESVLMSDIADALSSLSCYNDDGDMDKDGAQFEPDCDYEIIIKPKK